MSFCMLDFLQTSGYLKVIATVKLSFPCLTALDRLKKGEGKIVFQVKSWIFFAVSKMSCFFNETESLG